MQFDFNPEEITFDCLLQEFFQQHNAFLPSWSDQYQSIILCHDENQLVKAQKLKEELEENKNRPLLTDIRKLDLFTTAEDYHQKYYLQQNPLVMKEFENIFVYFKDFNHSTSATKINGLLSGQGSLELAENILHDLPFHSKVKNRIFSIY